MNSDVQLQGLLDRLGELDGEIENARPMRSLWTALACAGLAIFAIGASLVGASEWWLAANIVVIAALMSVPLLRVHRLRRERDRLLDTLERPLVGDDGRDRLPGGS